MATKLVMPKLGLTMTEALVSNYLKKEGDYVHKGEGVLEIETEKLTNVVESPADGVILRFTANIGDTLPIASVLAYIGTPGEALEDHPALED